MTTSVAVSVPLSVDGLVGGNVDDLGLGLLVGVDLRRLGSRGNGCGSDLDLSFVASFGGGSGGAGGGGDAGSGRGLGRRRLGRRCLLAASGGSGGLGSSDDLVDASGSLSTAHVEVDVLVGFAGLGLDVIGKDVRHLVAGERVVARHNRAPCVVSRGLHSAGLGASDQVITLLPGGAVSVVVRAVNVRDIDVVEVEARRILLNEVFELGDVVALALLGLGDFDRNTNVSTKGVGEVLVVHLAGLEGNHLVRRAAVALVNGPKVHIVGAAVVDTSHGLARIAFLVEGDCAPGGGSCGHGGRDGKDSNELHFV